MVIRGTAEARVNSARLITIRVRRATTRRSSWSSAVIAPPSRGPRQTRLRPPRGEPALGAPLRDERNLKQALPEKGRKLPLLQTPKAERDLAVAAASVLARDRFVRALTAMGEKWGFEFPKGSSHVVDAGVAFVRKLGEGALPKVAKVHFATTAKIRVRNRDRP
jgi:hypothetical protein